MKFPIVILFLLYFSAQYAVGATFVPPPPAAVSDDVMLSAIAEVESGNNAAKRGHYGERTQLQILPTTWREFSKIPHSASASHPRETDRVARAYLTEIRRRLRSRGLPETPFFIAAGWNAGAGWRHLHRGTVSYAERVANVAEATERSQGAPTQVAAATQPNIQFLLSPLAPMPSGSSAVVVAHADNVPVIEIGASN